MRISVFGIGYVGLVTGIGLSQWDNNIIFNDIDRNKLHHIERKKIPFYEPDLQKIFEDNLSKLSIDYNPISAVLNSDITIVCVGTPSSYNGSISLKFIKEVSQTIGKAMVEKQTMHTVIIKSTVIPGTIENIIVPILERFSGKKMNEGFCIASNPEFLREGNAVFDFFHPDRVIIGSNDVRSAEIVENLYKHLECPILLTSIKTAEMIKYVNNAFLATKISFANEIGNLCKIHEIDSYEVFKGVGLDSRINPNFFRSGIGFGGSCFPKDLRALITFSKKSGITPYLLNASLKINENQPKMLIHQLKKHLAIQGKTIGILGLAFKPNTDDIRETRAEPIIRQLIKEGANIIAYDPIAVDNFKSEYPMIQYASSPIQVMMADAILIITEWPEFEELDYSGKIVIDGRRIKKAEMNAKIYEGICW